MRKLLFLLFYLSSLVSQAQQPFITTWEVTAGDLDIIIPTNTDEYTYDYTIDFGDGTILTNQTGNVTHTYPSPGVYSVSISGVFPHFLGSLLSPNDANKLRSVLQWGNNIWLSMENMFNDCPNLVLNASDAPNLSSVVSLKMMFLDADLFNQSIDHWNVSNIEDMNGMFMFADSFNQPLNSWDVSSVEDMSDMFKHAKAFNQDLSNWDVSNVTDMGSMFDSNDVFNQDISNWNVSNVTVMNFMFYDSGAFNQNLSNWDFATNYLAHFIPYTDMSSLNYDLLINKLVELNINNGTLDAENIEYCDSFSRQQLINAGWTITDAGTADECDLNYVSGQVIHDDMNDGCDANDNAVLNQLVNVNNGTEDLGFAIDENGQFLIPLNSGNYTLNLLCI